MPQRGAASPAARPANASRFPTKACSSTATCESRLASARPPVVVMCMGLDSRRRRWTTTRTVFSRAGWRRSRSTAPDKAKRIRLRAVPRIRAAGKSGHRFSRDARRHRCASHRASGACRLAAITRRAPRRSSERSRPASRSRVPSQRSPSFEGRPSINVEAFRVRAKCADARGSGQSRGAHDRSKAWRRTSPVRSTSSPAPKTA